MKNLLKNFGLGFMGAMLIMLNETAMAAIDIKKTSTAGNASNDNSSFITVVENLITYIIGLLYFVAVAFGLYAGFQILTASGDEEKVKAGKSTMINVAIGIVVIFLSSVIVNWLMSLVSSGTVNSAAN